MQSDILIFHFILIAFSIIVVSCQPCNRPEIPVNARILPDIDSFLAGEKVSYRCPFGLIPTDGDVFRTCRSGTWTGKAPICLGPDDLCQGFTLFDNRCLFINNQNLTWTEARYQCGSGNNSQLVALTDSHVLAASRGLLRTKNVDQAWHAGHMKDVWRWTDGSAIKEFSWANGEPNNLRGDEFHLQLRMKLDYKWNDADGKSSVEHDGANGQDNWSVNKFICRYDGPCDPKRDSLNLFISVNNSCFVFRSKTQHNVRDSRCSSANNQHVCRAKGINWFQAKSACKLFGAQLAKFDTKAESDTVIAFIKKQVLDMNQTKYGGNYWIGGSFNKTSYSKKWRWSTGDDFATSSLTGPAVGGSGCGIVADNGSVALVGCNNKLPSLCTKNVKSRVCGTPPQAPNTKRLPSKEYAPGDLLIQECAAGYTAARESACQCTSTGQWDDLCAVSIQCSAIQSTQSTQTYAIASPSARTAPRNAVVG